MSLSTHFDQIGFAPRSADAERVRGHLNHPALAGFPLTTLADGRVVGEFFSAQLASVFQPIVAVGRHRAIGHHAYLRVASNTGESLTPGSVFAQAADDLTLVKLDRLTRSLHALNYFHQAPASHKLFVNIEQRLLATVANEHGLVFESILQQLDIKPDRVVISLPNASLSNAALLVRSVLSYRNRGYGVMIHVNGFRDPGLGRLFLAEPHFVQIDLPSADNVALAEQLTRTLKRGGVALLARKIETAAQAQLARDLGFDLLQGFRFGQPKIDTGSA
jgi:EAL domain-containing protein (putative c-di-GMP-specific phosphodiesterase class I)